MKALVVYDSKYGNTEEIAKAIAEALGEESRSIEATKATVSDLDSVQILVAGSPTYGGRPTEAMLGFLKTIQGVSLQGVTIAGFDTRIAATWVKLFGFAARKIENSLKKLGGTPVVKPEGFYVSGTKGPLVENELKRAGDWAKSILSGM